MLPKRSIKTLIKKILIWSVIAIVVVLAIFPVVWLASTSLKNEREAFSTPPVWIFRPIFDNYISIFRDYDFGKYLLNSIVVGGFSVLSALFLGTTAAYALSRFRFRGKSQLSFYILSTRIAPPIFIILPLYLIYSKIGLIDNYLSLILLYTVYNLAFVVWLMREFFATVPEEIDEAGLIDGCTRWQVFFKIDLPLVKSGLVATSIFIFIQSWNEFITAMVMTGSRTKTLPVAVSSFMTAQGTLWGPMAAAGTVVMLPMLIFGLIVQRDLVRGMTLGAIK